MTTLAFPIVFLGAIMTGELAKAGDATHAIISGVMTFNGILIMIAGSRRKPVNMGVIDQTPACYLWTYDLFPPSSEQRVISLDEAQALVRHVWFFYRSGEIAPVVKLIEDDKHASGYRYALRLPKWAFTQSIVLHEIAHSLGFGDNGFVDEGFKGHGPLYMKTIIDLYAMFAGADRQHMLERAAHFGLVVDTD